MKALTLTQPWATLVALGAKRIETRSWSTAYRGPLAIHAAKGFPPDCRDYVLIEPFRSSLSVVSALQLPIGKIIATCELIDILPTEARGCLSGVFDDYPELDTERERAFGDYSPNRFGWILKNVRAFETPIPAKGALSLWDWSEVPRAETPVQRETEEC
jgi:hypothetical protein